jgi:HAD superfamily hydrolase (TIGR01484 family)
MERWFSVAERTNLLFLCNAMSLPIQLISTDFDGTVFAEFENPPVPEKLQKILGDLQSKGVKWVINTGRDLSSLMEALARSRLSVKPDYLVLVEREIYCRNGFEYVSLKEWNEACEKAHRELFERVRGDLPRLAAWVHERYDATIYEDAFSPFCYIAESLGDAEAIHAFLNDYCQTVPHLTVMRNDVYARLSHDAFNKGSSLAEIARRHGISADQTFAAGDHLNDLPMLSRQYARCLAAPHNAVDAVKTAVRSQGGYLSPLSQGHGVADALERYLS